MTKWKEIDTADVKQYQTLFPFFWTS